MAVALKTFSDHDFPISMVGHVPVAITCPEARAVLCLFEADYRRARVIRTWQAHPACESLLTPICRVIMGAGMDCGSFLCGREK